MEKYNLHTSLDVLDKVKECVAAHIKQWKWLPVRVLGDLIGYGLSDVFGTGDLGWSPRTLAYDFQLKADLVDACISVPKPEALPCCCDGRTVREQMEDLASRERPTLKDWLIKNGIHNGVLPFEKVCMKDTLAILRRLAENNQSLYPELIEQLIEMRTLVHSLIGTGENCCDTAVSESAEAVRKTTRLDAIDALSYAIWESLVCAKDTLAAKSALNSIYGSAIYEGAGLAEALKRCGKESLERLNGAVHGSSERSNTALPDPCEHENIRAPEPNALFVTIETGMFEVTPENVEAVNSFVLNAGEGRDIHFRII